MNTQNIDPVWEEKYAAGHAERYPWDVIVSFIYRNAPRDRPRSQVRVLEVGCGTGSNLWFAAREGFSVAGIDGAASAIEYARQRFAAEGLGGDLQVADFTALPFDDASFDLVIDRAALTCVGRSVLEASVAEIARVLRPGGKFFFNPYSDRHSSSAAGTAGADGTRIDIDGGTLQGVGQIYFCSKRDVEQVLSGTWAIRSLEHKELIQMVEPGYSVHAEWWVIVEKV
ncbi:MAG: methylase involved in ubiquinone/menaquinone biosynthesis [Devosia sp.]|uniref:class I SAM-dependent methyltransferase n=1 Tax=Devosia sp. TaxID=1871048 RepID=UPI0026278462|nr:class I SAM-dependent methyltransferase [Devosia sp.]MDB5526933.1 methylase involved in ubiquinone/menaquinone biosynthesis [Devosia sp.]